MAAIYEQIEEYNQKPEGNNKNSDLVFLESVQLNLLTYVFPTSNFLILECMAVYFNRMAKIPKDNIDIVKSENGQLSIKRSKEVVAPRLKTFKKLPVRQTNSTMHGTYRTNHGTKNVNNIPFRTSEGSSINVEDQAKGAVAMHLTNEIS